MAPTVLLVACATTPKAETEPAPLVSQLNYATPMYTPTTAPARGESKSMWVRGN